jgi:hypothetical protein
MINIIFHNISKHDKQWKTIYSLYIVTRPEKDILKHTNLFTLFLMKLLFHTICKYWFLWFKTDNFNVNDHILECRKN